MIRAGSWSSGHAPTIIVPNFDLIPEGVQQRQRIHAFTYLPRAVLIAV
jgi:hypothetical protein